MGDLLNAASVSGPAEADKGYILVVDDDPSALALALGLLKRQGNYDVRAASSAKAALLLADSCTPLAVITDWQMPEMDGLQLVRAIRAKFANVPCIVVTAHGSEESAVEALAAGAASYVPKNKVVPQLVRTLNSVLAVRSQQIKLNRVKKYLVESSDHYQLPTERDIVTPMVTHIQESLANANVCAQEDLTRIGVALTEALINAIVHGNLGVSSNLLDGNPAAFEAEIANRMADPTLAGRKVDVDLAIDADSARITIRDEGQGFDVSKVVDPTSEEAMELSHGRGLLLIRAFMDEVSHNDTGNEITLIKRRQPAASAAVPFSAAA